CHAHKVLPVCELFIANSQGREAIRNGRFSDLDSIIENGRSEGMFSMESSLKALKEKGIILSEL
ncbi:MAG: hypothetical protein J6P05_02870, partial [Lachnospiraceae bacterium]|nr:hypothetical protein [Lachnospiraceae bacterium]